MKLAISRSAGRCVECACRYRPGEVVVMRSYHAAFHADCYRTRGAIRAASYEEDQPAELDKLLAVIQAEELVAS